MAMSSAHKAQVLQVLLLYRNDLAAGKVDIKYLTLILRTQHNIVLSPQRLRYWSKRIGITTKRAKVEYQNRMSPLIDSCLYLLNKCHSTPEVETLITRVQTMKLGE